MKCKPCKTGSYYGKAKTRSERMAATMAHFHTTHGMPEAVIWGAVKDIIEGKNDHKR